MANNRFNQAKEKAKEKLSPKSVDEMDLTAHEKEMYHKTLPYAVLSIAILLGFYFGTLGYQTHNENLQIKEEIQTISEQNRQVRTENEQKESLQKSLKEQAQLGDIEEQARTLIDRQFGWGSWGTYTENMAYIRENYPLLVDDERIDTRAERIGTGKSPVSSVDRISKLVGQTKDEVGFIVRQRLQGDTAFERKLWYMKFSQKDGELALDEFTPIRLLTNLSDVPEVADTSKIGNDEVIELDDYNEIYGEGEEESE